MRKLFCPVCATEIQQRFDRFGCPQTAMSSKLGFSIRRAVYCVDPSTSKPREPALAPRFWCPNCTGELEEHHERHQRLKCASCSLLFPAVDQVELNKLKAWHGALQAAA